MAVNVVKTEDCEKLIEATLGGDVSAFGVIIELHWNLVVALLVAGEVFEGGLYVLLFDVGVGGYFFI